MGARLATLALRIDALTLRERGILLAMALLALYVLADGLLFAPALQRLEQQRTEISKIETRLSALQARAGSVGRNGGDPLAGHRARIAELETLIAAQDAQFEAQLGRLVRPDQAAPLLRDVLQAAPGLRLLGMESAAGAPLLADSRRGARIVRYDLELRVEGGYLAALDYLKRLEALPWRFFWDGLELEVQTHPRSELRLAVYTLGQRP
ncbi:MAG: hypothetical protein ACOY5W_15260 [Pseudomonadota bacterium]